jgi:hypothetical protein
MKNSKSQQTSYFTNYKFDWNNYEGFHFSDNTVFESNQC